MRGAALKRPPLQLNQLRANFCRANPKPFDKDIMNQKKSIVKSGGVHPPIFGEYEHILNTLPRRIRLDAIAVIRLFKGRRRGKLTDGLLCRVWECSRATCQRRLSVLEQSGLLKRLTAKPKRVSGVWKQLRIICLLKPKPCVSKADTINPTGFSRNNSINPKGQVFKISTTAEMLSRRIDVPKRWFAYILRQLGASQLTYPLGKLWPLMRNRADLLESVLWSLDSMNPKPKNPAGWLITEVRARL